MDLTIDDALVHVAGAPFPLDVGVDLRAGTLLMAGTPRPVAGLLLESPVRGAVYGTLLNFKDALAALGNAVREPPYKAPPKAPVLYVKPRNTRSAHGRPIVVPEGVAALQMGASLGVVIGRTACRVREADALAHVAGYTIVNDVGIPHDNYYRPSIRYKCRDGFCPVGPWVMARRHVPAPDALAIRVEIDGVVRQLANTRDLVRPVARLLADVTEFMTLVPGDVLMVGVAGAAPLAQAGQQVAITIDRVGTLANALVAARAAP
jgi:5-oxopent-3-ene-1,2,5-tricarboxylate decarboxylase / 2-hydroxyhepta-2,4-diene-1,7-dioate isomerase